MLGSLFGRVMWIGRATSSVVGLVVLFALAIGAANSALAHTNVDNKLFHLGHSNRVGTATSPGTPTALVATLSDAVKSALVVQNRSGGPALSLGVLDGKAPLTVNAGAGTATNLSADELDGMNSSQFASGTNGKADEAAHADSATEADRLDDLDSADFQRRVSGQCPEGSSIRSIGADGTTLACEQDDDSGAAQVNQLKSDLGTNDLAPNQPSDLVSFNKVKDIPPDVVSRNAATLEGKTASQFANSAHTHSGEQINSGTVADARIASTVARDGEVMGIVTANDGAGTGLDADNLDGLDSAALQRRVSASCDPGSAVRAIGSDGSVTCETDDTGAGQVSADDMDPLPAARARTSNLGVANTTFTPLVLDFEDFDQVGAGQTFFSEMHVNATNEFTAPRAGIYEVQAEVVWAGSSAGATGTGERQIRLLKNTATCGSGGFYDMDVQFAEPAMTITNRVSTLVSLDPGGSVILCGYQNSGESLNASFVFADMHYVSGK